MNTRFAKGLNPWNAGRTDIRVSPKSEFKKGHLPANTLFDGAISIRKDTKTGRKYKYIRIALGKWELLQRKVWKDANGDIPKGYVVVLKDGDTINCELENLELISMADNARRNNKLSQWKKTYVFKEKIELGQDPTGVKTLSDSYVAGMLAQGSKQHAETKKMMLENPEIISLKRQQLQLNRALNKKRKNHDTGRDQGTTEGNEG